MTETLLRRREVLVGSAAAILTGCSDTSKAEPESFITIPTQSTLAGPSATLVQARPVRSEVVTVRKFYKPGHGNNLQPAFQAAIDEAQAKGTQTIVNDIGANQFEMWCPIRTSPFFSLGSDGIPLVIRSPVDIDFRGATFMVKGPRGTADKSIGQTVNYGEIYPWLGGWCKVVGSPGFGRVTIRNVTVDGGYAGQLVSNEGSNVSDKGFYCINSEIDETYMKNVELRNFAGEVYYGGGDGRNYQNFDNVHFHGSPQSAFNPSAVGEVYAVNLQAGRAYAVAESIGGRGQTYIGCRFYDAGGAGAYFFGGPDPSYIGGYHYSYALWDGVGEKPWVTFNDTRFEQCRAVRFGCWMRGRIVTTDTVVWFPHIVGHLRDIDLQIESQSDTWGVSEAVAFFGPNDLVTQVPDTPAGTFYKAPSDIRLKVRCARTARAMAEGRYHHAGVRLFGGLLDRDTVTVEVSGQARLVSEIFGNPSVVTVPTITTADFQQLP